MSLAEPQFESPYFASVDLGSNSFHLLVVRINGVQVDIVDREKEMVQIARGLDSNGFLSEDAQGRAIACLERFAERLRDIPSSQIRVVDTKTLRAASNSEDFLRRAERALRAPIQIISGYEEARLVYAGLAHSVTNDHSQRLVVDIGGGSTEFIIGRDDSPQLMESLDLGCVTYSENYILHDGGVSVKTMKRAYVTACSEIEEIRKNYLRTGWKIAYGTSGTVRAIAELLTAQDGGAVITKPSLDELVQATIKHGGINSSSLPELRKQVLPAGLAILQAVFDQLKLDKIHVANSTLKEGLVYDTIGRLTDDDARVTTVEKLQHQYEIDTAQAVRVANAARHFWKQTGGPPLPAVSRTKILRWAAALHEIGLSISHSGYHHHGYYILRHSDLAGFGRYEQHILANLVRSHRRKLDPARFEGMDEAALAAFIPLVICLRLAALLHRRREDLETLPTLGYQEKIFSLQFETRWLEDHPLTLAGLEQEAEYYRQIGLSLRFN